MKKITKNGIFVIFLLLITLAITYSYVSSEHTFYFWDYVLYEDHAILKSIYIRDLSKNSLVNLAGAIKGIWLSTGYDYSDLHTLPVIPFILTLGDSRTIYISALTIVYLIPFVLIIGALSVKLIPYKGRYVFWSAAFLSILVPAIWIPTLYGYPDIGAATLFNLALLIYVADPKLTTLREIVLIGLFIALAILFRRHYAYDAISFFVTISLIALFLSVSDLRYDSSNVGGKFFKSIFRIGLTVLCTVIMLAIIGWPFISRTLNTDFNQLYSSWNVPYTVGLQSLRDFFGWGIILLASFGFCLGIYTNTINRRAAIFFCIFTAYAVVQWVFFVRQLGIHYTLHFTTWIILGLVALLWTILAKLKGKYRALTVSAIMIFLCINTAYGLTRFRLYLNEFFGSNNIGNRFQTFFSAEYPPQRRDDYGQLVRLINYLHKVSSPSEPIYVVASSGIVNDDILWHANRTLHEEVLSRSAEDFWDNYTLNILHWIPFADSKHPYPLEKLMYSDYLVLAYPFQKHLRIEEHDVLRVVFDMFNENWEFSKDFIQLPEEFYLDDNVTVRVYKRIRPTSLVTAIHTIKRMQDYVGERPGGQPSWLILGETPGNYVVRQNDNSYYVDIAGDYFKKSNEISLVYLDSFRANTEVSANLIFKDKHCRGLELKLDDVDYNGNIMHTSVIKHNSDNAPAFSLTTHTQKSDYLLLQITAPNDAAQSEYNCSFRLENLDVSYQ